MSLYKKNRRKVSKNRKNASGHNTGRSSTKKSRSVKSNSLKQKMKKKRIRITAVAGLAVLLILTIILVVRSCIGERNQFVETDASMNIPDRRFPLRVYSILPFIILQIREVRLRITEIILMAFNIPGRRKQAVILL